MPDCFNIMWCGGPCEDELSSFTRGRINTRTNHIPDLRYLLPLVNEVWALAREYEIGGGLSG